MPAEFLESAVLARAGFRHAFFSRRGGVSSGPYESLNFSVGVGDDPERVRKNLGLAADALGLARGRIYFLSQVHAATARVLEGDESPDSILVLEGDALSSKRGDLACSVRTADCIPILAGDLRSGAAVAIHAGWRGIVRGVVEAGISTLRGLGSQPSEIVAAIGPHIRVRAFEVSEDVAHELEASSPVVGVVDRGRPKPHVDLARIVHGKLRALGVSDDAIDDVGGCTLTEADRFFSFRRDGKIGGRLLSAIVPRGSE